jgi:hypothetical protein
MKVHNKQARKIIKINGTPDFIKEDSDHILFVHQYKFKTMAILWNIKH